jgi:glycosyltransferase involved in cell wall biosynthesis
MTPECVVVMPVYNEADCIEAVCREWIDEVQRRGHLLLVVDDGSRDETPALLTSLSGKTPALRVLRQANGGHGSAVLRGYREALNTGCTWLFQVDSDRQFRASDFERLWSRREESDFILGRRADRQDPLYRRVLSKAHRVLLRLVFGATPQDPNVPYRLMRAEVLRRLIEYVPPATFAPNVLLAVLALRAGYPPLNIPVQHLPRAAGESTIRVAKIVRLCALCAGQLVRFRLREFAALGRDRRKPEKLASGA